MTLPGAFTPSQSGPGSDGCQRALCISQNPSITWTTSTDCLVSYPGHSSEAGVLPIFREAVGVFYSLSRLGKEDLEIEERIDTIQITALSRSARILRRVLETRGDLLSLKLQWKTPGNAWKKMSLKYYQKQYSSDDLSSTNWTIL